LSLLLHLMLLVGAEALGEELTPLFAGTRGKSCSGQTYCVGNMRRGAFRQEANLVTVTPTGVLTRHIIASTANGLGVYWARHDFFVLHSDVEGALLRSCFRVATPGVNLFRAWVAADARLPLLAQIHNLVALDNDFITARTKDVSWLH
jgi:hypothetical protein